MLTALGGRFASPNGHDAMSETRQTRHKELLTIWRFHSMFGDADLLFSKTTEAIG